MSCQYCNNQAVYRCGVCGRLLCGKHAKLRTICPSCANKTTTDYTITKMRTKEEERKIRQFVEHFWGEQEQLTFDRKVTITKLPTYIAKSRNKLIAFISYTETNKNTIIAALGVLPKHQNSNIGKRLIKKVEAKAKKHQKHKLLVSTSNDDLPALAFYQKLGFQIYQIKPNIIAEKHGKTTKGINGLPIRDEIRLQKTLH